MGVEVPQSDLAETDRDALRAFGRWLATRPDVDAEVRAAAGDMLRRAAIPWPPADAIDRDGRGRAAALEHADWRALDDELRALGRLLAEAGASPGAWFPMLATLQRAAIDADAGRAVIAGAVVYGGRALRVIGDAYAARQRELLRAAHDETALYGELVRQAPGPKVVYEWRAPPDRTTFVLIAANPAARKLAPGIFDSLHRPICEQYPHFPSMELCDRIVEALETGATTACTVRPQVGGVFDATVFPVAPGRAGVVFHDVSELAQRMAEVQEANRSLDAFAYVASHDLKAPLRDIANLATWIDEDAAAAMPAPSRKHLAQLRDRVVRMDKLLDDLLAYSRAGRVRAPDEDVTVRGLVDEAVALAGPREGFAIAASGLDVALRAPRPPLVHVLRNLVDNALKHHDRSTGTISIDAVDEPGAVRFTVGDDGPGIPPAFRDRVFQPFTTLRPRDRVEGSGMGLAIVKKLIESHGGRIEIEPREGRGTRVTFTWPRAARPRGTT